MTKGMEVALAQLVDHLESCPISVLALIVTEIQRRGQNRAKIPVAIYQGECLTHEHQPCWSVTIEVDMRSATFDIEAHDTELALSMAKALRATRRELSSRAAVA